jgi:hypothetical protein
MKFLILLSLLLSTSAVARDNDRNSRQQKEYESRFGTRYQYDLSKPSDRLRYEVDPSAQIRDEMSVDPRRDLDRDMGQYGGGIKRRR